MTGLIVLCGWLVAALVVSQRVRERFRDPLAAAYFGLLAFIAWPVAAAILGIRRVVAG